MFFGTNLKKEREKRGWSQDYLAKKLYVSRQSISKWEMDKNYPNIEVIIEISHLFNITVDELLKREREEKTEYIMTKIRSSLIVIASIFILTSIFVSDSFTAFLCGVAGIIGIATWGYSSEEVLSIVKSKFNIGS